MARHPLGHPAWLDVMDPDRVVVPLAPLAGNPDVPLEHPAALVEPDYMPANVPAADLAEDPEEEEEADYLPFDFLGHPPDEDSEDERILGDILLDDAQPEECLSTEEVSVPPTPIAIPYYQSYLMGGKEFMQRMTPRVSENTQPDIYSFVERAISGHARMSDMHGTLQDIVSPFISGQKRKAPEGSEHFEFGESSQAPPPVDPTFEARITFEAQIALEALVGQLTDRIQALEDHTRHSQGTSRTTIRRVEALEEEERQDTEAIRTLYHRVNATRTDVINLHIRSGDVENSEEVTQAQISAAERTINELRGENRQLQEQFDELVRYLAARFGR